MTLLPLLVPLLLPDWMDPEYLIHALGNWALWGVALILIIECSIFPILPGDSLLFVVDILSSSFDEATGTAVDPVTTTAPAPITAPLQIRTGSRVALEPMVTRSPISVRPQLAGSGSGAPLRNRSLANITP